VTSLAAAAIHFAVMGEHFAEYMAFGIFFSSVGWLQALWAVGVMVSPTRRLLLGGLMGNAVVALVWVVSRTTGLPIGPESGVAEPAALVDVLSTILEVAIVVGSAVLLVRGRPTRSLTGRAAWLRPLMLVVALALLTTWAIGAAAAAGESRVEHGAADEGAGEATASTTRPGFARADLGNDRMVQVLIDSSATVAQVHLTFFEAGTELEVQSASMSGASPSGEDVDIPVAFFEPGHYAASMELEPGDWTFRVEGVAADGWTFDVSLPMTIEEP
jgi:hypothetical protein